MAEKILQETGQQQATPSELLPDRLLRLTWGGTDLYVVDGPVTLTRYNFSRDKLTPVRAEDADGLLARTVMQGGCCGGGSVGAGPIQVLEEVE